MTPTPTLTPEEVEQDLIRALANALHPHREFALAVPDEATAHAILFEALDRRCPCGQRCRLSNGVLICPVGHHRSLKAASFKHSKLPVRVWLAAIWHLHVDDRSIAARSFARTYRIDKMSAWRLLHRVRAAFPLVAPATTCATAQTMGRQAANNEAHCIAMCSGDLIALVDASRQQKIPLERRAAAPATALFIGRFVAWLTWVFRGVRRHHQEAYLAEFAYRERRSRQRTTGFHRSPPRATDFNNLLFN